MSLFKASICFTIGALAGFPAFAQTFEKKTTVTVNEAFEVPGAGVLQPGTYIFKLADPGQGVNRHVVQILSKDQSHVFAMLQAIPDERLVPTGKTVLTFYEMPKGQPEALRAWFYPGDSFGQEFAYPKARASEISQSTGGKVPEETGSEPSQPAEPQAKVTQPQASPAQAQTEPIAPVANAQPVAPLPEPNVSSPPPNGAANDSPSTPIIAQNDSNQSAPPSSNDTQSSTTPQTLPQTGSDLPLVGLFGLGFLAAAGFIRFAPVK